MCLDEGYVERCCLHHILSEIFSLNTFDANANDTCEFVEVLWRSHHASRRASHRDFSHILGEADKSDLNRGSRIIYACRKNRWIPGICWYSKYA
jgi:hypothetical protein